MRLTDLEHKNYATTALKENFEMSLDTTKLDKIKTKTMLSKVSSLMQEAQKAPDFYKSQGSAPYMKLVFMEQALRQHFQELMKTPTRIVVENEEVEKSQVVLAAQDMVDTMQKMLEDVGQMQVKELPALVDSIESEIGVTEAQGYNELVSAQLDALSGALKEAFTQMKAARDTLTGGAPAADAFGADAGGMPAPGEEEVAVDASATEVEPAVPPMAGDTGAEAPAPAEEPEVAPTAGVGRAKR
jgi:hypothetical protein